MPYNGYYTQQGFSNPEGSRSIALAYSGMACPFSMDFSLVHGTSPGVGTITFDESDDVNVPMGFIGTMQIGFNIYRGITIARNVNTNMQEGTEITYKLVDLRDKLHDNNIFGAFNIIDQEGRMHHVLPRDWRFGRRTYISQLTATDFQEIVEQQAQDFEILAGTTAVSGATLLNLLARDFSFTWSASPQAYINLKTVKPENLDWNSGVRVIEAIQAILDKSGLQFTEFGDLHLHITLQGLPEDEIQLALLQSAANLCELGFTESEIGTELNTKGRRVLIVGEPNKYQFKYGCVPNWNQLFDYEICYNEFKLAALILANGVDSFLSPLSELPEEYHDHENWNGKPRNEMAIKDYVNEICFKCYVVDFNQPVSIQTEAGLTIFTILHRDIQFKNRTLEENEDGELEYVYLDPEDEGYLTPEYDVDGNLIQNDEGAGFQTMYWGRDEFDLEINSIYPISDKLINHSDKQFLAYASTHKMLEKGQENPFNLTQQTVPITSGASLDIEEILNHDTSQSEWRVRVIFSESRYYDLDKIVTEINEEGEDVIVIPIEQLNPQAVGFKPNIIPDTVYVDLCTDRELFIHRQGELENVIRLREQKVDIPGLKLNFLEFDNLALLCGNLNKKDIFETQTTNIARGYFEINIPRDFKPDGMTDENFAFYESEWVRYDDFIAQYSGLDNVVITEDDEVFLQYDGSDVVKRRVLVQQSKTIKVGEEVVINPVKATDIAPVVGASLLFHNITTSAGGITFEDSAGFVPDGLIQSVNDSWNASQGIQERINFSNDYNIRRFFNVVPVLIKEKEIFDENALIRKQLEEIAKVSLRNKQHNLPSPEQQTQKTGGDKDTFLARARVFGDDDSILVKMNVNIMQDQDYETGELLYYV